MEGPLNGRSPWAARPLPPEQTVDVTDAEARSLQDLRRSRAIAKCQEHPDNWTRPVGADHESLRLATDRVLRAATICLGCPVLPLCRHLAYEAAWRDTPTGRIPVGDPVVGGTLGALLLDVSRTATLIRSRHPKLDPWRQQ